MEANDAIDEYEFDYQVELTEEEREEMFNDLVNQYFVALEEKKDEDPEFYNAMIHDEATAVMA